MTNDQLVAVIVAILRATRKVKTTVPLDEDVNDAREILARARLAPHRAKAEK